MYEFPKLEDQALSLCFFSAQLVFLTQLVCVCLNRLVAWYRSRRTRTHKLGRRGGGGGGKKEGLPAAEQIYYLYFINFPSTFKLDKVTSCCAQHRKKAEDFLHKRVIFLPMNKLALAI